MTRVAVIGCGVIGATIAYELSQVDGLEVRVFDRHLPGRGATQAALGVMMGAISQKIKSFNLQMRLASIQHYDRLIPELEQRTGRSILFNRQGILHLCFEGEDLSGWENLIEIRRNQGWQLELLDREHLQIAYPQVQNERLKAAVYSPQDRQIDPLMLTLALVTAAEQNGTTFQFNTPIELPTSALETDSCQRCDRLQTPEGDLPVDWVVLASGLGSLELTKPLGQPVDIRPVLGQALQVELPKPLGQLHQEPIITGEDIHVVPVGDAKYWIGATVEFPLKGELMPDADLLMGVLRGAIEFCPGLASATITRTWSGLRPRPEGRPAPVIGLLPSYNNVLLATGHYRNGVVLAPATAQMIREAITGS